MLKLNFAVASDRGLVRGNNEDSAYAGPYLLALADGMGGHAAGEIASQLMINHIMRLDADPEDNDMLALLGSVAEDANRAIAEGVREAPETDGMGTTLTALMFNGSEFGMCHVGDSRGYRLRDGKLEQITVDDTYVQSLVERGELDPEDISTHPRRSLILKAYTGRPVEPTLKSLDARVGDRLLLCSDGLSDPVTASTIEQTLRNGTPQEAAFRLVELALRSGGPDNVTVVIADVVDGDSPDIELPTVAVTAGALNGEQPEDPRPDTAAGRAAMAIQARQSRVIPPEPTAQASSSEGASAVTGPKPEKKKSAGKRIAVVVAVLAVLALIAGGLVWFKSSLNDTYYVTTDGEELVIEQGSNIEILGKKLHQTYQRACLDESDNITLVDPNSTQPCHRFTLSDLKESARSQVTSLPEGTYDEVQQQMQRLASEALPICVTREAQPSATPSASPGANPSEAPASSAAAEPSASTSEQTPPKNAPGDQSTPGVNCREVN